MTKLILLVFALAASYFAVRLYVHNIQTTAQLERQANRLAVLEKEADQEAKREQTEAQRLESEIAAGRRQLSEKQSAREATRMRLGEERGMENASDDLTLLKKDIDKEATALNDIQERIKNFKAEESSVRNAAHQNQTESKIAKGQAARDFDEEIRADTSVAKSLRAQARQIRKSRRFEVDSAGRSKDLDDRASAAEEKVAQLKEEKRAEIERLNRFGQQDQTDFATRTTEVKGGLSELQQAERAQRAKIQALLANQKRGGSDRSARTRKIADLARREKTADLEIEALEAKLAAQEKRLGDLRR